MVIVLRILSFVGWMFAGFFGLMSLVGFTQSPVVGIGFSIVAAIFCPPLYRHTRNSKKRWSIGGRVLAFFLGLVIVGAGTPIKQKAVPPVAAIAPSPSPSASASPSQSVTPSLAPSVSPKPYPSIVASVVESKPTLLPSEKPPTPSPSQSQESESQVTSSSAEPERPRDYRNIKVQPEPPDDSGSSIASQRLSQSAPSVTPSPSPSPSPSPEIDPMDPIRNATHGKGCDCPYDFDKRGGSCGGRSAYSRPGGRSPICYVGDRR